MKKLTGLLICGGIVWCSSVVAAELPSLEKGKLLFNSEKLGTSGKNCAINLITAATLCDARKDTRGPAIQGGLQAR